MCFGGVEVKGGNQVSRAIMFWIYDCNQWNESLNLCIKEEKGQEWRGRKRKLSKRGKGRKSQRPPSRIFIEEQLELRILKLQLVQVWNHSECLWKFASVSSVQHFEVKQLKLFAWVLWKAKTQFKMVCRTWFFFFLYSWSHLDLLYHYLVLYFYLINTFYFFHTSCWFDQNFRYWPNLIAPPLASPLCSECPSTGMFSFRTRYKTKDLISLSIVWDTTHQ